MTSYAIEQKDIVEAKERIAGKAKYTPIHTNSTLNSMAGSKELYFKCENFQKGGAFKFRGACNAVLKSTHKNPHFITHSSGNHAQAVALACKLSNVPATVVMPENAPQVKKTAVAGYGATVIECESTNKARQSTVDLLREQDDSFVFIHPSNDIDVMAGQGTIGLELIEQIQDQLDIVFVPVGGGGLSSGVAMAIKSIDKSIKVIGVEPEGAADAHRSFKSGQLQGHDNTPPNTIADGLKTQLGCNNWPIIRDFLDDILLVNDQEIINTMRLIYERMKLVIEPSGAVAMAGVLSQAGKAMVEDKRVADVISGGNVDLEKLPWN